MESSGLLKFTELGANMIFKYEICDACETVQHCRAFGCVPIKPTAKTATNPTHRPTCEVNFAASGGTNNPVGRPIRTRSANCFPAVTGSVPASRKIVGNQVFIEWKFMDWNPKYKVKLQAKGLRTNAFILCGVSRRTS